LYFHCLTASTAALLNCPSPLSTFTWVILPSLEIVAIKSTRPSIRIRRAPEGYVGATFLYNSPWDTPCETLTVCRTGLNVGFVVGTKSGGGALLGVAIPIKLGAAAESAAAALVCVAGALPPLTRRGAGSGSASASPVSSCVGFALVAALFSVFATVWALSFGFASASISSVRGAGLGAFAESIGAGVTVWEATCVP